MYLHTFSRTYTHTQTHTHTHALTHTLTHTHAHTHTHTHAHTHICVHVCVRGSSPIAASLYAKTFRRPFHKYKCQWKLMFPEPHSYGKDPPGIFERRGTEEFANGTDTLTSARGEGWQQEGKCTAGARRQCCPYWLCLRNPSLLSYCRSLTVWRYGTLP